MRVVNNSKPKAQRVLSPHVKSISLDGVISIRDDEDDVPVSAAQILSTPIR